MVQAPVLHRLLLLLVVIGLIVSIYAAFEVLDPALQGTCSINSFFSCSTVDSSGLTHVGPVPDWLIGVAGFTTLLIVDVPLFRTYDPRLLYALFVLSLGGIGFALYFAYVELALVGAVCPVCTTAHLTDVGVFLTSWKLISLRRSEDASPEASSKGLGKPGKGNSRNGRKNPKRGSSKGSD